MRDVTIDLESTNPRYIRGDTGLAANAFRNLIDKALKYARRHVRLRSTFKQSAYFGRLSLDQGRGFLTHTRWKARGTVCRRGDRQWGRWSRAWADNLRKTWNRAQRHHGELVHRNGGGQCVTLQFNLSVGQCLGRFQSGEDRRILGGESALEIAAGYSHTQTASFSFRISESFLLHSGRAFPLKYIAGTSRSG